MVFSRSCACLKRAGRGQQKTPQDANPPAPVTQNVVPQPRSSSERSSAPVLPFMAASSEGNLLALDMPSEMEASRIKEAKGLSDGSSSGGAKARSEERDKFVETLPGLVGPSCQHGGAPESCAGSERAASTGDAPSEDIQGTFSFMRSDGANEVAFGSRAVGRVGCSESLALASMQVAQASVGSLGGLLPSESSYSIGGAQAVDSDRSLPPIMPPGARRGMESFGMDDLLESDALQLSESEGSDFSMHSIT
eukprot:gb/GFBE01002276.1/.p1 GENE.gb/GFBE01002276.1/~~gb/GFBE01002276.1/.p1  ORF type:complete len:251 (+),score=29.68 gb/GFBE01002276.1/:1-753(+)